MNCRLTDFATYEDLVAYIKCRDDQGGSPQHCLSVGDNGVGASGKTTATDDIAMVALPRLDIQARWGSTSAGWGKMVNVTYQGRTIKAELADIAPTGVCDLNPAALAAMGQKHPFSGQGSWEWEIPVPAPAPTVPPKMVRRFGIFSTSPLIGISDVLRIADACNRQVTGEYFRIWGRQATVEGFLNEAEVPVGYIKVVIKDDIGEPGAFGFHTDVDNQPICFVKAQDVDNTCVTCSHEIVETISDPSGDRFIVIDLPPYGKVRCLVETADPPESFAYADHGLPVSDWIVPEWYDEVATAGMVYSYKGHIKTPQTLAPGGYFSFKLQDGRWMQQTFFGSQPIFEGPFNWQLGAHESLREMVDRETRARRNP